MFLPSASTLKPVQFTTISSSFVVQEYCVVSDSSCFDTKGQWSRQLLHNSAPLTNIYSMDRKHVQAQCVFCKCQTSELHSCFICLVVVMHKESCVSKFSCIHEGDQNDTTKNKEQAIKSALHLLSLYISISGSEYCGFRLTLATPDILISAPFQEL